MNAHLKSIHDLLQQAAHLTSQEKQALLDALTTADKQWSITDFKLERTEQTKRTTTVLLEETIEELEHKRKAVEAQKRELKIEAALERVRAIALSMKVPADMLEVCRIISQQLEWLHVKEIRNVQTAIFNRQKGVYLNYEFFRLHDKTTITEVEYDFQPDVKDFVNQMLTDPEAFFTTIFEGTKLKDWMEYQEKANQFVDPHLYEVDSLHYYFYSIGPGALGISTYSPLNDEEINLFKRFRNVFELAYRRYTDIEKAEAQAREAQIEAALEKVRARVMAMNSSKELNETSLVFGEQLRKLGIDWQFSYFWLMEEEKDSNTFWITWPDNQTSETSYSLAEADESFQDCIVAWKRRDKIHSSFIPPADIVDWLNTYERITADAGGAAVEVMKPGNFKEGVFYYDAMIKFGSFGICTNRAVTEEEKNIQYRFAVEFERAYTRFLDLKKAEAQSREAQIELGLERVRARAMAMQKTGELKELIGTVSSELGKLDIVLDRCFIMIYDVQNLGVTWWMANPETSSEPTGLFVKYHEQPPYLAFIKAWQERIEKWQYILEGKIKKTWDDFLFVETELAQLPDFIVANMKSKDKVYLSASFNNFGCLTLATLEPLSEEQFDIMLRFAKVFDLTYTRFSDLKKAETQAREAKIEAALERVRSKSMAMHRSEELDSVIKTIYSELKHLDVSFERCFIMIFDEQKGATWWMGSSDDDLFHQGFYVPYHTHPPHLAYLKGWKERQQRWEYLLEGQIKKEWDEFIFRETELSKLPQEVIGFMKSFEHAYLVASFENFGCLTTGGTKWLNEESLIILSRFAKVFDQTYSRFLDLQKAEAQAREAKIEASLERVRAKAMAMHSSQDLADTIGVFYKELHSYSITPRRCGVGLLNKKTKDGELFTWNTTEQGESLELMGTIKMEGHPILENVYVNWLTQTEYHPVLKGNEIKEYYKVLRPQIAFPDYQHDAVQYGYFFFFKEGGVYAWTAKEMKEEELKIYRRFTSVLSLTYKRYEDLKLAEANALRAEEDLIKLQTEKKRAEEALSELQATQAQLIQSEKMASLGELTAGIAHEIQNPLNFVNNFSELNLELINEMQQEMKLGNAADALDISNAIKDNLEKVAHHGKRADAIVKNMLQHSRKTTGQKVPIDINALVDEFLRLSYHGLRAKDKSFNAILETHFDPSVGKVPINGQDIGRVLINLFSNAFYSVHEKKKQSAEDYQPTVAVSTRKTKTHSGNSGIEIIVKDNGTGIPEKVLEKIYQPFFTTKPAGEGTGLGLSLSYDIITKGHGGELKVDSIEREYAEFIIRLPV